MSMDNSHAEFPSTLTREWSIAQAHLIYNEEHTENDPARLDPLEEEVSKEAYTFLMNKLDSRTSLTDRQMGNNLFEDLLSEKSYDLDKFKGAKKVSKTHMSLR